ncbi:MAG: ABC transporter ATP-binding protein/permease [candidate division Zixibacteria bacterium]|nr:ABC transporter ATP-binding protein/permease [candidate division Zixibacteria bacterium]MDH4034490.1 ABC transporter ATP-binding protein/permease [candidate division Zixibacteria bacterium]
MTLYRRTFSILRPYIGQLITASLSAAIHALLSGLMVWMAGPLLMTLFQVQTVPGLDQTDSVAHSTAQPGEQPTDDTGLLSGVSSSIEKVRTWMKGWVNSLVEAETRRDTLFNFCWLILLIALGKNLFNYLQGFFMAFVQQSVVRSLRDRLFEKYQRLSLAYFHRRRTGQIMSRVTNDVIVLNESVDIGFNHLVADTVMALSFFSFLIILSWKLTLLAMIVLPVVFGFIWFVGKTLRRYSERTQQRMADVNSVLEEAINNTRIVKAFSMEKFETNKFVQTTADYFRSLLRMTRIRHLASPINDTLISVAGVVILMYAGARIIAGTGELDAGDFMTFIIAMFAMIKPVKSLSQVHIKLQEGMAAAERIFRVLEADETISDPAQPKHVETFRDVIRYQRIDFSYNPGEPVLSDVSFDIRYGQVVAIVGPSGAGKSTLLDLLPRFYDPQGGSITIDGIAISELSLASLRGLMGIVTQETFLFNDTIFNNVAYGLTDVSRDRVVEAARMANADRFIREFENGYDTLVGNRGVMLSGGQRQRLAIARALLKNPQILIFDEATSALDTESELLVQEAISRLMKNRTTLVVAHRLSTIVNADRIVVLKDGRIVEEGRHEELLQSEGLYHRLYMMQFKNGESDPASGSQKTTIEREDA